MKIGFVSSGVLLGLSAGALRSVLFGLNYELQSVGIWGHVAGAEGPERSCGGGGGPGKLELSGLLGRASDFLFCHILPCWLLGLSKLVLSFVKY